MNSFRRVLLLLLQLITASSWAQLQLSVDLPAPSSDIREQLHDGQVRDQLLSQAWKAAEALQNPEPGDELAELSARIKELKQQLQQSEDSSEETKTLVKELEQQRILLLRQGMLKRQFQMPPEEINTKM